jgi:hypothetical protein
MSSQKSSKLAQNQSIHCRWNAFEKTFFGWWINRLISDKYNDLLIA